MSFVFSLHTACPLFFFFNWRLPANTHYPPSMHDNSWDGVKRFDEKTGELVDADTKAALAALVVKLEAAGKQHTAEVAATKA